ncbi:MAG TPA: TIGR00296 family protein [Thermoproteales archaeon]|nr:TIGR00296 family protein [Thermoproteales archaeon]
MAFKPYSLEEGRFLVRLARKAVEEYIKTGKIISPPPDTPPRMLSDPYGVFTTIEVYNPTGRNELRGCIGFPRGYKNVVTAVIQSAIAAATEDPRFPPMSFEELGKVVFEVSVLSPLKLLKVKDPRQLLDIVKVGVHGLVVEKPPFSGLLLPQVPVEYGWSVEEFLSQTCMKAWLPPDCWFEEDTKIYSFEAQLFTEVEPGGEIVERDLLEELSSH